MIDQFGNVSTTDLLVDEATTRQRLIDLEEAVRARLLAECPVKIDKVYRIKPLKDSTFDQFVGRRIYVQHIKPQYAKWRGWWVAIEGPLERFKTSPTRNGYLDGRFTSRHQEVPLHRIDLSTESDP